MRAKHGILALLAALLLAGCGAASTAAAPDLLAGELALRAPAAIQASQALTVVAERADAPEGLAATLVAQGSYGARVYRSAFARGRASFTISGEDTRQAGALTLIASAGAARGQVEVAIRPGPPADPLTPLVGPRSVIADGEHQTMVLAVPFDSYGNPVADGTPVEFRILHPGGQLETHTISTTHLLAWAWVTSSTSAGRAVVTASAEGAHGPDASYTEIPGWPAPFGLLAAADGVPADGRQLVTLRTEVIRDRFGNPMVDGTLVTLSVDTPDGATRLIPAYTIDGAAEAQLQAPDTPGDVVVRATLYGVESRPLTITFAPGPAVGSFPVGVQVNTREGVLTLTAGPLLGPLGQFVPDGTPVQFRLSAPDGGERLLEAKAERGCAVAELRLAGLPSGAYQAEVLVGSGRGTTAFQVP